MLLGAVRMLDGVLGSAQDPVVLCIPIEDSDRSSSQLVTGCHHYFKCSFIHMAKQTVPLYMPLCLSYSIMYCTCYSIAKNAIHCTSNESNIKRFQKKLHIPHNQKIPSGDLHGTWHMRPIFHLYMPPCCVEEMRGKSLLFCQV